MAAYLEVHGCQLYNLYLDTDPVMLTHSTTIWSLSEYFFGARVANADSNDPPCRKIVRVSGIRVCINLAKNLAC